MWSVEIERQTAQMDGGEIDTSRETWFGYVIELEMWSHILFCGGTYLVAGCGSTGRSLGPQKHGPGNKFN